MKHFGSDTLIDGLMSDVREIILAAEKLRHYDKIKLTLQPAEGKWSVAQVLEHMNFYSRFYLSAIESKIDGHTTKPASVFKSGWFGNYFTNMMRPKDAGTVKNKMKALKSATPPANIDPAAALEQFVVDQHHLLNLLQISRSADLNKIRVPTSITKWISLKLGDTFRFLIAHEQRHFVQIREVLNEVPRSISSATKISQEPIFPSPKPGKHPT